MENEIKTLKSELEYYKSELSLTKKCYKSKK